MEIEKYVIMEAALRMLALPCTRSYNVGELDRIVIEIANKALALCGDDSLKNKLIDSIFDKVDYGIRKGELDDSELLQDAIEDGIDALILNYRDDG